MIRTRSAAIIVAGGSGRRIGGAIRKQYLNIAGEPILLRALRPFLEHSAIDEVVLVLPEEDFKNPAIWLDHLPVRIVAGGDERGDSVWNGLQALSDDVKTILIHDGARPFVTKEIIHRVLTGAAKGAVIAAIQVTDTIKAVDSNGLIARTLDRKALWRAQTPQGFPSGLLRDVYSSARRNGVHATDDAALFELQGLPVRVVAGSPENLKITEPTDLIIAEAIALRDNADKTGD